MLQVPFPPPIFLHFLLGFCLILDGMHTPILLQRAFLTHFLVVPGILLPQTFPPLTKRQRLVQQSPPSHCSSPFLIPSPQKEVWVREDDPVLVPVPVPEGDPVPVGV